MKKNKISKLVFLCFVVVLLVVSFFAKDSFAFHRGGSSTDRTVTISVSSSGSGTAPSGNINVTVSLNNVYTDHYWALVLEGHAGPTVQNSGWLYLSGTGISKTFTFNNLSAGVYPTGGDAVLYYWDWDSSQYVYWSTLSGAATNVTVPVASGGNWVFCSNEGGTCSFSGTKTVRYGANGVYASGSYTNSVGCNNGTFGDPISGVAKTCEYDSSSTSPGWTFCANEGGSCTFTGTRQVRYGANGSYLYANYSNGVACNTGTFGADPASGILKSCDYSNTVLASATANVTASATQSGAYSDGPLSVPYGSAVYLKWSSTIASSCSMSPSISGEGIATQDTSGFYVDNLTTTTTYTLTCDTATDSVTINVAAAATADLTVSSTQSGTYSAGPISVAYNSQVYLKWSSTIATSCSISPSPSTESIGTDRTSGMSTYSLTTTTTYTLTCGTATDSVTVNVAAAATADLKVSATQNGTYNTSAVSIANNLPAYLQWSSSIATSCSISPTVTGFSGTSNTTGLSTGNLTTTTTYTLTCDTATDSVTVTVDAPTLSATLTPSATTGIGDTSITLSASTEGTAVGTMNYSFWWNCSDTATSVSVASVACGFLNSPSAGSCLRSANRGYKCNGVNTNPQVTMAHTYTTGSYTPKVIVERDGATPAENRSSITIGLSATAPTITATATTITQTSATISTNVTSLGIPATLTGRQICFGSTAAVADCVATTKVDGVKTLDKTSLSCGSKYYYKGTATNATGIASATGDFTTLACDVATADLSVSSTQDGNYSSSATVVYGSTAYLKWSSTIATSCSISPSPSTESIGTDRTSGMSTYSLTTTTTYTLTCGTATDSVTVNVSAPTLSATLSANPTSGIGNTAVTLSAEPGSTDTATGSMNYNFWYSCNSTATTVSATQSSGVVGCGTLTAPPYANSCIITTNVGYKCNGVTANPQTALRTYAPGTYTPKVIIERSVAPSAESRSAITIGSPAIAVLSVSSTQNGTYSSSVTIAYNTRVYLKWSSFYASSCSISPAVSGFSGTSNKNGLFTRNITTTTTYTLTCGTAKDTVTVNVPTVRISP